MTKKKPPPEAPTMQYRKPGSTRSSSQEVISNYREQGFGSPLSTGLATQLSLPTTSRFGTLSIDSRCGPDGQKR